MAASGGNGAGGQDAAAPTSVSIQEVALAAHVAHQIPPGFEPGLADRIQTALADSARLQEAAGEPAVLLVAPKIRPWIARLMRHSTPSLAVLAYNEIPENRRIRVIAAVGR